MPELQRNPDQEFAEWYVWAKREVSTDNRVCHGAAQAALQELSNGGDREAAARAARRSQAGYSLHYASQVPPLRRSYAEWYDWARREIGGDSDRLHEATAAAISTLQRGGGSAEAAAAARSVAAQSAPPAPAAQPAQPAQPAPWERPVGPQAAEGGMEWERADQLAAERSFAYAGFWRRLLGFLIDLVIILLGVVVLAVLIDVLLLIAAVSTSGSAPTDSEPVRLTADAIVLVLVWLYFAGLESSGWQATVGKRIVGARVTDRAGRRLSFGRATARYFAKILSALPLLIGFLLAAFTRRKQALHDFVAGTVVLKRRATQTVGTVPPRMERREPAPLGSEAQRV